mmetsp:Transcript_69446/g.165522  ORF Transcript_69446/g.165522 Transcript_69446/m.165522 type:complete len:228 (+) Transcript_69446:3211-3894(+)
MTLAFVADDIYILARGRQLRIRGQQIEDVVIFDFKADKLDAPVFLCCLVALQGLGPQNGLEQLLGAELQHAQLLGGAEDRVRLAAAGLAVSEDSLLKPTRCARDDLGQSQRAVELCRGLPGPNDSGELVLLHMAGLGRLRRTRKRRCTLWEVAEQFAAVLLIHGVGQLDGLVYRRAQPHHDPDFFLLLVFAGTQLSPRALARRAAPRGRERQARSARRVAAWRGRAV